MVKLESLTKEESDKYFKHLEAIVSEHERLAKESNNER